MNQTNEHEGRKKALATAIEIFGKAYDSDAVRERFRRAMPQMAKDAQVPVNTPKYNEARRAVRCLNEVAAALENRWQVIERGGELPGDDGEVAEAWYQEFAKAFNTWKNLTHGTAPRGGGKASSWQTPTSGTLAMAPLRPKVKREHGKDTTLLCGVRDCREILCHVREGEGRIWIVAEDYAQRSGEAWIKSERATSRSIHHKQNLRLAAAEPLARLDEMEKEARLRKLLNPNDDVRDLEARVREGRQAAHRMMNRREDFHGAWLQVEQLPITMKCAQCGRINKITSADR